MENARCVGVHVCRGIFLHLSRTTHELGDTKTSVGTSSLIYRPLLALRIVLAPPIGNHMHAAVDDTRLLQQPAEIGAQNGHHRALLAGARERELFLLAGLGHEQPHLAEALALRHLAQRDAPLGDTELAAAEDVEGRLDGLALSYYGLALSCLGRRRAAVSGGADHAAPTAPTGAARGKLGGGVRLGQPRLEVIRRELEDLARACALAAQRAVALLAPLEQRVLTEVLAGTQRAHDCALRVDHLDLAGEQQVEVAHRLAALEDVLARPQQLLDGLAHEAHEAAVHDAPPVDVAARRALQYGRGVTARELGRAELLREHTLQVGLRDVALLLAVELVEGAHQHVRLEHRPTQRAVLTLELGGDRTAEPLRGGYGGQRGLFGLLLQDSGEYRGAQPRRAPAELRAADGPVGGGRGRLEPRVLQQLLHREAALRVLTQQPLDQLHRTVRGRGPLLAFEARLASADRVALVRVRVKARVRVRVRVTVGARVRMRVRARVRVRVRVEPTISSAVALPAGSKGWQPASTT
eukprot:scaffold1396_cov73-Phaeocystis_antarctica.AAC.2